MKTIKVPVRLVSYSPVQSHAYLDSQFQMAHKNLKLFLRLKLMMEKKTNYDYTKLVFAKPIYNDPYL